MSDIKQAYDELFVKYEKEKAARIKAEINLKQREALHTSAKVRYILEKLEEAGKPDNITPDIWRFTMSRAEKWNNIFQSDKKHPWVKQFLKCVGNCCSSRTEAEILLESQEIVKILFNIFDAKIHSYYQDSPINMSVFNSNRIKCAIECLTNLESEITAFLPPSSSFK